MCRVVWQVAYMAMVVDGMIRFFDGYAVSGVVGGGGGVLLWSVGGHRCVRWGTAPWKNAAWCVVHSAHIW